MNHRRLPWTLLALLLFFCLSSPLLAEPSQPHKNVLLLNSYHPGYKWTDDGTQGALEGLGAARNGIHVFVKYMDTKLVSSEPYFELLSRIFAVGFENIRFDLIIAMDDDAFNFLKRYRDRLFPDTPVVFGGVNWFDPDSVPAGFKGYTGINEDADIAATLDLMLKLHPGTKKIYVIDDTTTTGKKIRAQFDYVILKYQDKVSFVFLDDMDMSEILDNVGKLGKDSLVLLAIFQQDKSRQFFEFSESAGLISKSSKVPCYGLWDFNLGFGIVGGMLTSGHAQGEAAGEAGLRILNGEKADAIAVQMKSPNRFMFDYTQLQRWNINRSDLPGDSVVINEPVSFYALHKGLVWEVVSGFLGLGVIIVLLVLNIRGRRQRERELRKSEEKYHSLVDNINIGVFRTSPVSIDRFLQANPAMIKIFGYESWEDLSKISVSDLYRTPEERILFVEEMARNGFVRNKELAMRKKDGTPIWISINATAQYDGKGEIKWIDGVSEDITEKKQADDDRKRFLAAIEQTAEAIVITNAGGDIQFVNPAFERITGYSREEAIGQNPRILKSGEQNEHFYRNLWETISGGDTWAGSLVNRRKNGALYTEKMTISPVRDASGLIVNYVAVKRDITETLRLAAQFQQAQKMEAVGILAGGVAHDYNNMLSVIIGFAELTLRSVDLSQGLRANLEEILNAAKRSADITRQLLAFARKQTIMPVVFDLNRNVESMLKMLRRLIGENIDLVWLPKAGMCPIKMDPIQADQILANLCVNARDAIADVGKVIIETADAIFDETYCAAHFGFIAGDFVLLTVTDDGSGMDQETLTKIFDPFFTSKGAGRGTGLGLSTVYGIVKQNNGFITVYSEPGKGTTFKIYLPSFTDEAVDAQPEMAVEIPHGHSETVLIVENEPALLNMAKTMLEQLEYRVLAAGVPAEAMALAEKHLGQIQLLITDVIMPGMNGRDLATRLQSLAPDINVLFMSGYTADVITHRGVLDEGLNFIQKPFSLKELAVKVRGVLKK